MMGLIARRRHDGVSRARRLAELQRHGRERDREHEDGGNRAPQHHRSQYNVVHSATRLSRNALAITETELSVIAALAQIGLINTPKNG
jgi:hypothetical protein